MDAQTLLKTNGARADELVQAVGSAAGAVAKAIEEAAGPLAGMLEDRASTLVRSMEERAVPLAGTVGAMVGTVARSVEERAAPLAEVVGAGVGVLSEDLEEKFAKARKEVTSSVRNFKFGTREGLIIGVAVGVFAAIWLIRKMDREATAARLRAVRSRVGEQTQAFTGRVGEATHGLTSRVGEATHGLTDRAGALASQAGERVGQAVQSVGARAGEVVQQVRGGQGADAVEEAKLRLSDATSPVREVVISESAVHVDAGAGLDRDTRAAIDEAVQEVERVEEEAREAANNLGLSNGMKVVAFDGTDIGRVQEVREDVFVLDRPRGADLLVPLTEIARIEGTVAYLRIELGQVTKMGWEKADKS